MTAHGNIQNSYYSENKSYRHSCKKVNAEYNSIGYNDGYNMMGETFLLLFEI